MFYVSIISFAFGIIAGEIFDFGYALISFLFLMIFVSCIYMAVTDSVKAGNIFIVSIFFIFGILRLNFVDKTLDEALVKSVGQNISIAAKIVEEPDKRETGTRYVVSPQIDDQKTNSNILVVADRLDDFEYGNVINIIGKLEIPKNFKTDSGEDFDYINYLSKDKIHFVIYRPEMEYVSSGMSFINKLFSVKKSFIEKISAVVPEPDSSLLAGLLFGTKQSIGETIMQEMRSVGLVHIVVLSGYNITIVATSILSVFTFLGNKRLGFVFGIIFVLLFVFMVGLGATVVRAVIMSLICILARFLGRPRDALRAMFLALFVMIMWNPLTLLYDPSFKLSFMATLGLILFSPIIYPKINFVTERFGLREIVSSTFAVQIFLLPILINMSGSFSIISFLVNPLVLPFVPLLMFFSFITGLFGFVSNYLSIIPGAISFFLTSFVLKVVHIASSIEILKIKIGAISTPVFIIWYFVFTLVYFKFYTSAFLKLSSTTDQFKFEKKSSI